MPTWRLRGLEIWNPDDARNFSQGIPEDITFDHKDEAGKKEWEIPRSFEQRRSQGLLRPFTQGNLRYCFNVFNPQEHGNLGVLQFPNPFITVALRFVCHLASADLKDLVFPNDVEIEVEKPDRYQEIRQEVLDLMPTWKGVSLSKLFKGLYRPGRDWDLELWILPQRGTRLYKYDANGDSLGFMHQKLCDKKDMRLFMEVHVVPKVKPAPPAQRARSGREIKGKGRELGQGQFKCGLGLR